MEHTYTAIAYNKYNNELVRIDRPTAAKAIKTAQFWMTRGAAYVEVIDENYTRYYWEDKQSRITYSD